MDSPPSTPAAAASHVTAKPASSNTIAVVGGGFAGTTLVRRLAPRLPAGWTLVLISEESYTTFNPMLPEVVGASVFPEQVVAPIRSMFKTSVGARFIMGRVSHIHLQEQTLKCDTLAGPQTLSYQHLVLCVGNRARLDLVPGMMDHALPLKTVGDAMHIRNVVLRRLAHMELESDPQRRVSLGQFVVIGGGFSGVEVAGELVDCLDSICRYYPLVARGELGVTVLQDLNMLLPELPPALGQAAAASLSKRGVKVRLGCRANAIDASSVTLADGERLPTCTVISTIGNRANALLAELGLPTERGRLIAGPDFAVPGTRGVWALGDCACVPNGYDRQSCPPTAQFAVRQARHLADNLLATLAAKQPRPFAHKSLGAMAAIGHKKGVADIMGLPLSGLLAWMAWRAYYLWLMPTWGRKLRIFVEWTWGMFFPADITHLRFTRSVDLHSGPPPTEKP